jgi:hypothetical protein
MLFASSKNRDGGKSHHHMHFHDHHDIFQSSKRIEKAFHQSTERITFFYDRRPCLFTLFYPWSPVFPASTTIRRVRKVMRRETTTSFGDTRDDDRDR